MARLDINRRTVRALSDYHALLRRCRRLGNVARARTRVLREEWSACGLEPACRDPELGRHVFHGVLLTPRAAESVDRGMMPAESALVLHAGVLLEESLPLPGALLRNPDVPELQVGLTICVFPERWSAHGAAVEQLCAQLEASGFEVLREQATLDSAPEAGLLRWFAPARRLSLASLLDEADPAAAAGRFFGSALKPLEQLADEQVEALLLATGHGEVYERELPR
ncbi:MAG: hypothetical protein MUE46_02685 [Xanthomonadales bacterium]|jgi:hypothetical protein|nr:hypothetical protein [Xanthomonadales bacterium]